jgi:hypothetical protein
LNNVVRDVVFGQLLNLPVFVTGRPLLFGPLECFVNPAHYSLSMTNNHSAIEAASRLGCRAYVRRGKNGGLCPSLAPIRYDHWDHGENRQTENDLDIMFRPH